LRRPEPESPAPDGRCTAAGRRCPGCSFRPRVGLALRLLQLGDYLLRRHSAVQFGVALQVVSSESAAGEPIRLGELLGRQIAGLWEVRQLVGSNDFHMSAPPKNGPASNTL